MLDCTGRPGFPLCSSSTKLWCIAELLIVRKSKSPPYPCKKRRDKGGAPALVSDYPLPAAAAHFSGSTSQSWTSFDTFSTPTVPCISPPGLPSHTTRNCALLP